MVILSYTTMLIQTGEVLPKEPSELGSTAHAYGERERTLPKLTSQISINSQCDCSLFYVELDYNTSSQADSFNLLLSNSKSMLNWTNM